MQERKEIKNYWSDKEKFERWLLAEKIMTKKEYQDLLPGEQMRLKSEWDISRTDLYTGSLDSL